MWATLVQQGFFLRCLCRLGCPRPVLLRCDVAKVRMFMGTLNHSLSGVYVQERINHAILMTLVRYNLVRHRDDKNKENKNFLRVKKYNKYDVKRRKYISYTESK
ncbi:hypothetical protein Droror1_Dr00012405 [Drosera rotundifolia]